MALQEVPMQFSASLHDVLAGHPLNVIVLVVAALFALVFAAVIAALWGITLLLALIFLFIAFVSLLLNRGRHVDALFLLCIIVAIILLVLYYSGVTLGTVDLSMWPVLGNFTPQ